MTAEGSHPYFAPAPECVRKFWQEGSAFQKSVRRKSDEAPMSCTPTAVFVAWKEMLLELEALSAQSSSSLGITVDQKVDRMRQYAQDGCDKIRKEWHNAIFATKRRGAGAHVRLLAELLISNGYPTAKFSPTPKPRDRRSQFNWHRFNLVEMYLNEHPGITALNACERAIEHFNGRLSEPYQTFFSYLGDSNAIRDWGGQYGKITALSLESAFSKFRAKKARLLKARRNEIEAAYRELELAVADRNAAEDAGGTDATTSGCSKISECHRRVREANEKLESELRSLNARPWYLENERRYMERVRTVSAALRHEEFASNFALPMIATMNGAPSD